MKHHTKSQYAYSYPFAQRRFPKAPSLEAYPVWGAIALYVNRHRLPIKKLCEENTQFLLLGHLNWQVVRESPFSASSMRPLIGK